MPTIDFPIERTWLYNNCISIHHQRCVQMTPPTLPKIPSRSDVNDVIPSITSLLFGSTLFIQSSCFTYSSVATTWGEWSMTVSSFLATASGVVLFWGTPFKTTFVSHVRIQRYSLGRLRWSRGHYTISTLIPQLVMHLPLSASIRVRQWPKSMVSLGRRTILECASWLMWSESDVDEPFLHGKRPRSSVNSLQQRIT